MRTRRAKPHHQPQTRRLPRGTQPDTAATPAALLPETLPLPPEGHPARRGWVELSACADSVAGEPDVRIRRTLVAGAIEDDPRLVITIEYPTADYLEGAGLPAPRRDEVEVLESCRASELDALLAALQRARDVAAWHRLIPAPSPRG